MTKAATDTFATKRLSYATYVVDCALEPIRDCYECHDVFVDDVTFELRVSVAPYWEPEYVTPDGRPMGTDPVQKERWRSVRRALVGAGFRFVPPTSIDYLLRKLAYDNDHSGEVTYFVPVRSKVKQL